jgi:hypothetical protein
MNKIILGDTLQELKKITANSINIEIISPPFIKRQKGVSFIIINYVGILAKCCPLW